MTTPGQENENQTPFDVSYAHSVNTVGSLRDYIISEDLLAGQRTNGRMSNVRRFFCLFVTFDFLFTSLMWIICVMLNGEYIVKALIEQVVHYNIHTSLFDIVLVSFCRFFILILFYAIIYINHWIVISLSTAVTCAFLIAKVLYFDWPHSSQPVFEVLLVLASFVLAWGEAWFLDFRVIPQENYANRFIVANERTPLIRSYVQGLPSTYTESVANFYSPQGTPENSVRRFQPNDTVPYEFIPIKFSKQDEDNYKHVASKNLMEAWKLFDEKDWVLERKFENDQVYTRLDRSRRKIFKLQAPIDVESKYLLDELFYREHDFPTWNSNIKECYKIHSFNENTDITYTVSKEAVGGLVACRDFVNLRHWGKRNHSYIICVCKTEHPSFPVTKKIVRGENNIGCFVIETMDDSKKSVLHWIVNIDMKLWLPGTVLDSEMTNMMFNFIKELRNYISSKTQEFV